MLNSQKQKGISLLELILVLAIASSFFYLTINMYYQWRAQLSQTQLLANVDQLFQAMEKYYQANCRLHLDYNGHPVSAGALDPAVTSTSTKTLSIVTDLFTPGFLNNWHPSNLLVDSTPTENGYYVQFNRVTPDQTMNTYACTGVNDPISCNANQQTTPLNGSPINNSLYTSPPSSAASHVVIWRMQVAVKLLSTATPALQALYMQQMNAECLSYNTKSSNPVPMCQPTPPLAANVYLVWERLATFVSGNTSDFWLSQPNIKQFNMQYTNDTMQLLNNGIQTYTDPTTGNPVGSSSAYYLCGE